MSEENLAVVKAHFEAMRQGDMQAFAETLADDYINHAADGDFRGKQTQIERLQRMNDAFTVGGLTIDDQFAAGDKVVTRFSGTLTHAGDWMGVPATGKQATHSTIHVSRVENGKIVEIWRMSNDLQVLQQLGLEIPPSR